MKKLITILYCLSILASGCGQQDKIEKEISANPGKSAVESSPAKYNSNVLAFDLYRQLSPGNKNLFFSPFSISSALAMSYTGAGGETKSQIKKVLHMAYGDSAFCKQYHELDSLLKSNGNNNQVNIGNALWAQNNLDIETPYINRLKNYFAAEANKVDFIGNPSGSCNEINNWVSQHTNGRINNAVSPGSIGPLTRLIITSTIYFNMDWEHKFFKEQTKKDVFTDYKGEKDSVWFMNTVDDLSYYEDEMFQVLNIPYKGPGYSMVFFLPKHKYTLSQLDTLMDATKFERYMKSLYLCNVLLYIPKFKFQYNYELTDVLSRLGMPLAFTDNADFSCITRDDKVKIDEISHSAFIEIDEEKTEAAAGTISFNVVGSAPIKLQKKKFRADSPFMFMIVGYGHILFVGKVQNLN